MNEAIQKLLDHKPSATFLVAIDSDGCAFDTMELKQKECFIPNTIKYWNLQAVSKYAREASEFVNLYSKWRGANRFPALIKVFDLLMDWDKVKKRKVQIPTTPNLRKWAETETKLGNPTLEAYCKEHPEQEDMQQTLEWSKAVNRTVADIVKGGLPPFPYVEECLQKSQRKADVMVCSQTPTEALIREWEEQDLARYVFTICGQEIGTKAEHIKFASENRYAKNHILMIGDAYGDMKAARANNALFFPINPGNEDESWQRLYEEGLDRFFNETYEGEYEALLIKEFEKYLPETPPWKK